MRIVPRAVLAAAAVLAVALPLSVPVPLSAQPGFPSLALGQRAEGRLEAGDPALTHGGRFRVYQIRAEAGRRYVAWMNSDDFDAYISVARTVGGITDFLGDDDDGGGGLNARLRFTVPETGTYLVIARALSEEGTGSFTVGLDSLVVLPPTVRDIAAGQRLQGEITDSDPEDDNGFFHIYRFRGNAGQRFRARFSSEEIGGMVSLGRMQGNEFVAFDDDETGGWGNTSMATLPETGTYYLRVGSWGDVGPYEVALDERVVVPLSTTPLQRGTDLSGTLGSGDAELDDGRWVDAYTFTAAAGEEVTITLRSDDFDAYVMLGRMENGVFAELESNDDAGGEEGLNSRLVYTISAAGTYVVQATSFSAGGEGAYQLRVQP